MILVTYLRNFLLVFLLLTSTSVLAQKIILVKKDKAVIVTKKGQKFKKNIEYYATGKKSDAMFKVLKKRGRKIVVKFYNGKLFKGDKVSIEQWAADAAELDEPVSKARKEEKEQSRGFQFGVSFLYNNSATGKFNGIFRGTESGTYSIETNYDPSFGVGGELRYQLSQKYSIFAGAEYHLAREAKTVKLDDTTGLLTTSNTIQTTLFYGGLAFNVNPNLYLPVALSYNLTNYYIDNSDYNTAGAGGIGYQIGFGYWVNANIAVEAIYRSLTYSIQYQRQSNGDRFDSEEGPLTSIDLALKYFF